MPSTVSSLRRFPLLYGLGWALFIAVVGTLLVSFWKHFGTLSDVHFVAASYTIHCVAVIWGAVASSRAACERGWYHGGITGLMYTVIMILIGLMVDNSTFTIDAAGLFRVLVLTLIGAFGGMIGVNTVRDR